MTLLLDSSVWLAWMRADGEPNRDAANAIVERTVTGGTELRMLDLTVHELGNVLVRAWRESATTAEAFVSRAIAAAKVPPLVPTATERRDAYELAEKHGLSVYDATYAAVASKRRMTLISGDGRLVRAGLAVVPAEV